MRAVLAAMGLAGASAAGATDTISIDPASMQAAGCFGYSSCTVEGVNVSSVGGTLAKKVQNNATGFGINGGPSGSEIDIGETLNVTFGQPRSVVAIKVLFLYNGPEFNDKAEKATVKVDGTTTYTLSVLRDADDAGASWDGHGTVTKCGATTSSGTGCFLIEDPFPGAVSTLAFQAAAGGAPYKGSGSNNSDYSLGFIDVAAQTIVELQTCAGEAGCPVATVDGNLGFSLNSMLATNPGGGSTEALVIPLQFPDCRYVPQACLDLLPPAGDTAATDDARRALLIGLGVIKPLDPYGPDKLNPAAQMLNVTPLLPPQVTSLFDGSGMPPDGLPALYIGARWRGQLINDHRIDAFFFKTESGVVFNDVFGGLVDVSVLTGNELGCVADPGNLLAWDMITTVSELAKSVGGRYVDMPVNVGCVNPSKVTGSRLSLFSINLEPVAATYGRTIKSSTPKVTVNNDAVFARMVQSLWKDIGEVRSQFVCKQFDPSPTGGVAPLSSAQCKKLASLWSIADFKIDLCVASTFGPSSSYQNWICGLAAQYVAEFKAAIPATASGPDPYNRRSEIEARTEVFQHIWAERFLKSIKPGGFCREKGSCPP
jgi:hypothetical protein